MAEYQDRYCIIGAGPGGLSAAVAFQKRGIPFDVFDKGQQIGGMWDINREETPVYQSAHFISSKTLSGFRDFPMPDDYPDYPRHDQIFAYIQSYAAAHNLEPHITLNTAVEHINPVDDGQHWEVNLSTGETRTYKGVCIANGLTWFPNLPEYPGQFEGECYHSFYYKSPDEFRDKRVLIVGAGNSGCDIACDAARSAKKAFISLRRGYYFLPKYVFGMPTDVFGNTGPSLPLWLERPFFEFMLNRVLVGKPEKYGLPKPDHHLLESHPIVNTQILHYLGHGDISAKPDVAELKAHSVVFTDGTEEEIDLIIYATGYKRLFPFIDDEHLMYSEGHELDLYMNVFHRRFDNLFFIGVFETDGGGYSLFNRQAEVIASFIQAQRNNTPVSAQFRQAKRDTVLDLHGGMKHIDSPRHVYYVHYRNYAKLLEKTQKMLETTTV